MERLSRRSFMKIACAATGGAALAAAPPIARAAGGEALASAPPIARAAVVEEAPQKLGPKSAVPEEPLVAYVRDAERGEVTDTSGTTEHTYRDRALVQRLLRAAGKRGVS